MDKFTRAELAARIAIGMPIAHPERVTAKPRRAEWRHLAARSAELWPNDEYAAIVSDAIEGDKP